MNLHRRQLLFGKLFSEFIVKLHELGYEVKHGETMRTKAQALLNVATGRGIARSLHIKLLAGDLELFKDLKWLTELEDYKEAAELWESMHYLCTAGYYFGDGPHFSITYQGIR